MKCMRSMCIVQYPQTCSILKRIEENLMPPLTPGDGDHSTRKTPNRSSGCSTRYWKQPSVHSVTSNPLEKLEHLKTHPNTFTKRPFWMPLTSEVFAAQCWPCPPLRSAQTWDWRHSLKCC